MNLIFKEILIVKYCNKWFFIIFISTLLWNVQFLFSRGNKVFPKDNSVFAYLHNKGIIFPKNGDAAANFFKSDKAESFWRFSRISSWEEKDFSLAYNASEKIPSNIKKACFAHLHFNICAFWQAGEEVKEFYFIDPHSNKESIFDTMIPLVSPQIFSILSQESSS